MNTDKPDLFADICRQMPALGINPKNETTLTSHFIDLPFDRIRFR